MSVRSETRIPVRAFNAMASWVGRSSSTPFNPDQLMDTASKKIGLNDFGDDAFLEGLTQLCDSMNKEANLHPLGRISAINSVVKILSNRLELEARWREYPELLDVPIKRPVFIVGPPRTGTTLLFNLLALDDRFRFIRSWEAARPGLPRGDKKLIKKAKEENRRYLGGLYYLRPELKKIHYLAPEKPEECIPLLNNSFESDFFSFAFNTKSYFDWFREQSHKSCYTYYRKQLQWIQSKKPGKRWLLKSPSHLWAFDKLFELFPDALVLQTHRDPKSIIPSLSNMKYNFQSICSYEIDKKYIGETTVNYLSESLQDAFESREKYNYDVVDIQYKDLVKKPTKVLEQVYNHMGETLNYSLKECAKNYLSSNPKNKYGKHIYSNEEIGLEKKLIRTKFDFYYNRFNFAAQC